MRLVQPEAAKRVSPRETLDYAAFTENHRQPNETSELHVFEKFNAGKIVVEPLGWFGDQLDQTLQETFRLIDVLGNETRMRMLAPLFRKTGAKKEYRTSINPKLVYKNLETFLETGLIDEMDSGNYELSQLGKSIMADFIAFLERTRRTLDSASKSKGGEKSR